MARPARTARGCRTLRTSLTPAPGNAVMVGQLSGVRLVEYGFVDVYGWGDSARTAPSGTRLLAFAAEQSPAIILDCATLTGAARVALGPDLPAIFSNDDALARIVQRAGDAHHDAVWHLPLRRGYDSWLDSTIADLNNVASRPMAGAVVAALFLNRFVPAATPWLHVDLYAWNDASRPGRPEGGEAQALRALHSGIADWLSQRENAGSETT